MTGHLDELRKLVELRDMGALSDAEFDAEKRRILNGGAPDSAVRAAPAPIGMAAETTIATFRSSTRGWLLGSVSGLLTVPLLLAGLAALFVGLRIENTATTIGSTGAAGPMLVGAALIGVAALRVAARYLRNVSRSYELTSQRIVVHRGIVLKRTDEIELYRVKDTRVDYSLLNQIAGIGSVTILSTDATTDGRAFVMPEIPNARVIRETLRGLVEQLRMLRGVREMDLDTPPYDRH